MKNTKTIFPLRQGKNMSLKIRLLFSVCLIVLSTTSNSESSTIEDDDALLTPGKIKNILTELSVLLDEHYIHQQKARQYALSLSTLAESDALFSITDPDQFKLAISDYLQTIHPDGHLRVYDPVTTERLAEDSNFDDEHDARGEQREQFLRIQYQSAKFIHLSVSILPYGETYEQEVIDLLASLPKTERLVLDLRNNKGGSARTVREMLNCLLPEVTPLYSLTVRSGKEKGHHSHSSLPITDCNQIANTPMTVLVNEHTASAAELLALILKNRDRAVVIGKNTYGAGNPVELFFLPYNYSVYIPISTIVDSVTGDGFELVGVKPDITIG